MLLIDVTRLLGRLLKGRLPTGVDRVGIEYLRHFRFRSRLAVRLGRYFLVLPETASDRLALRLLNPGSRLCLFVILLCDIWRWRRPLPGAWLINTGHSGLEHAAYPDWIASHRMKLLVFIHDLIPISHPQFSREGESEKHRLRIGNALVSATGIVVNSSDTLSNLCAYANAHGLPMPPAAVALLAPAQLPSAPVIRPLPGPYFLMLGTLEGRKNHALLLSVWRRMPSSGPKLVLIGQRGWRCQAVFDALDHDPQLSGKVLELSRCSDQELAGWLKYAQALLFPSRVEGYGMPLVESLAAGTPVIASQLPVFQEIVGQIPDYLDPLDAMAWETLILDYNRTDSPSRKAQLVRLRDYQSPSWAAHFAVVDNLLNTLT